jgi:hypothetical protein
MSGTPFKFGTDLGFGFPFRIGIGFGLRTFHSTSTYNQFWFGPMAIADTGKVFALSVFLNGNPAAFTGGPVLYDATGNVLLYTATPVPSVAYGTLINLYGFNLAFSQTSFMLGGFRANPGTTGWDILFDVTAPTATYPVTFGSMTGAITAPLQAVTSGWSGTGTPQAFSAINGGYNVPLDCYGWYYELGLWVRRSSTWIKPNLKVNAGGVTGTAYVLRGGGWSDPLNFLAKRQELPEQREFRIGIAWSDGRQEEGIARWGYGAPRSFGGRVPVSVPQLNLKAA